MIELTDAPPEVTPAADASCAEVDVPAAVVLKPRDRLVPAALQADLAGASRATAHLVDGGHDVAATAPEQFVPMLVEACDSVARRAFRGDTHEGQ